jgi:hypothetical protein
MAFLFSSAKHRNGCLTSLASGRTWGECSVSSLGTPDMSFGDHAKMSRFSRRKLVSSLSYLAERLEPLMVNLEGSLSSSRIFLVL